MKHTTILKLLFALLFATVIGGIVWANTRPQENQNYYYLALPDDSLHSIFLINNYNGDTVADLTKDTALQTIIFLDNE